MQNIHQTNYVLPYFKHIYPSIKIYHFRWLSAEIPAFSSCVEVLWYYYISMGAYVPEKAEILMNSY
jgi:hypothetical protein